MPRSSPERIGIVRDLALSGKNEAEIAEVLRMERKVVRNILQSLVDQRILSMVEGGGHGRRKRYERGPLLSGVSTHLSRAGDAPAPSLPQQPIPTSMVKIGIQTRMDNVRWTVPVFQDEMSYRDTNGITRRWTLGLWSGDYKEHRTKGRTHFTFKESKGTWELVISDKSKSVRAAGKKNRVADRIQIGYVMLMPKGLRMDVSHLPYSEEIEFALVLDLLREIGENRRLVLHGIPIKTRAKTEFAPDVEIEGAPSGRTEIVPGKVWVDHSPKKDATGTTVRKGEPETNEPGIAKKMVVGFEMLKTVPDLPDRLERLEERWEKDIRDIKRMLQDVLDELRRQP